MDKCYTTEEFVREVAVDEYLARFHNPDKVWGYCRACSNYGKQWGCPPFDFDVVALLSKYRTIRLIATKIAIHDRSISPCKINAMLRPERIRLERTLLDMERQYNTLASTYIGECLHCANGACARLKGEPCCHPEVVRPSLEAYGFDITRTLSELFDIELKWSTATTAPSYIVLVCALFHNSDLPIE